MSATALLRADIVKFASNCYSQSHISKSNVKERIKYGNKRGARKSDIILVYTPSAIS